MLALVDMNNTRRGRSRKGCRRNRRQMGGNTGQSYTLGEPLVPNNPSLGAAVVSPFPSCGNAVAPGYLQGVTPRGLPGFAGGRRSRKRQQGGVYTAGAPVVTGVGSIGYLPRVYTGCGEGAFSAPNSLNQHGVSTITAPPAMKGGMAPVDGMVYEVPRAGYTGVPSNASGGSTLADGRTPFLVHQPYSAQLTPSSACLKTGGGGYRRNKRGTCKNGGGGMGRTGRQRQRQRKCIKVCPKDENGEHDFQRSNNGMKSYTCSNCKCIQYDD